MAMKDLNVIVTVSVANALESLGDLQESLEDVADKIRDVDNRGSRGISVNTDVDEINNDLARLTTNIEGWERANSIDIETNVEDTTLTSLAKERLELAVSNVDANISTMDVDAGVVHLRGGIGGGDGGMMGELADTMRNSMRNAMEDIIEDGTLVRVAVHGRDDGDDDTDVDRRSFGTIMRRFFQGRRGDTDFDFDLGETTRALGRSFNGLMENSKLANLSMSDLHNAVARIIPLLLVFVGALPALISAMVTLAAAAVAAAAGLAALTGLGALGFAMEDRSAELDTQQLLDRLSELRDNILESLAPLAHLFEDLFADGIDGLERLFQVLAQQRLAFTSFASEARAFGGFLLDFLPQALRALSAMVNALAGEFAGIGRFINENFTNILRVMVETTMEALPAISSLLQTIAAMVPTLIRMSVGFVRIVNDILRFIGAIGTVLGILGIAPETFGYVVAVTLALSSATLILLGLYGLFGGVISTVIGALSTFSTAVAAVTGITGLLNYALIGTLTLLSMLGIGLITAGASMAFFGDEIGAARSQMDKLNSSLSTFDRISGNGMTANVNGPSDSGMGSGGIGGSSGTSGSFIYNDYGGDSNPDNAAAYQSWRQNRTTGDRA